MSTFRQRASGPAGRGCTERVSIRLHPDPAAVPIGRHALDRLEPSLEPGLLEEVRLLVSELVTNSVRHAQVDPDDWIDVSVEVRARKVVGRISDPGVGFDLPPDAGSTPPHAPGANRHSRLAGDG